MKALCVCQYGQSRSVGLARCLRKLNRGYEAASVGWESSPSALPYLCEWAEVIFTVEPSHLQKIPARHRPKVVLLDLGPDIWSNPYHPDLYAKCLTLLARHIYGELRRDFPQEETSGV
jgi:predicted protein tyrosine phosphatase